MADFLVLDDANAMGASGVIETLKAARIISDADFDIDLLKLQGVALIAYVPDTMGPVRDIYLRTSGSPNAKNRASASLIALLLAEGLIGGPLPFTFLTTGLICAYEARRAVPDVNGQLVNIPDLSGNGNEGTCPAALGARPVLATNAQYKDQVTAAMAGVAGHIIQRATWVQGLQAQPTTVYWIGEQENVGSTRTQYDGGSVRQLMTKIAAGGFTAAALLNVSSGNQSTEPVAVACLYDGASSEIYVDDMGTPAGSGNAGNNGSNGVTIAGTFTGTPNAQTFCAYYAYASKHTQSQREAMVSYFRQEFGVGTAP